MVMVMSHVSTQFLPIVLFSLVFVLELVFLLRRRFYSVVSLYPSFVSIGVHSTLYLFGCDNVS